MNRKTTIRVPQPKPRVPVAPPTRRETPKKEERRRRGKHPLRRDLDALGDPS